MGGDTIPGGSESKKFYETIHINTADDDDTRPLVERSRKVWIRTANGLFGGFKMAERVLCHSP
jgi:hypothetical protein